MRAVLDTNVLVSGFLFGGVPLKIIRAALQGDFFYVTSPSLQEELNRVLSTRKFGLTKTEISDLTSPLLDVAMVVYPEESIEVITRCPADNRVLECAIKGSAGAIVTGDKRDLIKLIRFKGIPIQSPRAFLDRLTRRRVRPIS